MKLARLTPRSAALAGALFIATLAVNTAEAIAYRLEDITRETLAVHWRDGQGVHAEYTYAGEFTALTADYGYRSTVYSYCTDLAVSVYLGATYQYDLVTLQGQTGLAPVWSSDGGMLNAAFLYYNNAAHAHGDQVRAAGLQLAIWEALYDSAGLNQRDGLSLTSQGPSDRFWVSHVRPEVVAAADEYLNQLGTRAFLEETGLLWLKASHADAQGMFYMPAELPSPLDLTQSVSVPDSASTAMLLLLAASAIALFRHRWRLTS